MDSPRDESGAAGDFPAAKPQSEVKHPPEWQADLNPNHLAGQNLGPRAEDLETGLLSAYDRKDVHRGLSRFADDELKQIPILSAGRRLQQGATYIDLRSPERGEFTATGGMTASDDDLLVPKAEVPYTIWNRLRGIDSPERVPERGGKPEI